MKELISKFCYPLVIAGSISALIFARETGGDIEDIALIYTFLIFSLAIALERYMPADPTWNNPRGDFRTDATSAAALVFIVEPVLKYFSPIVVIHMYSALNISSFSLSLLHGLPFWAQLVLAFLAVEFGLYWSHRWHHENRFMWWTHAMHHSSERLYVINGFKFNPINYLVNFVLSTFPLIFLGVSPEVLFGCLIISQPILVLQHANIDLKSGFLNFIFSTNEVHRWHHSNIPSEANRNYGSSLIIWDHLFRTFKYTGREIRPHHIGLFAGSSYPAKKNYLEQLRSVLSPDCCNPSPK